jgi:hypothetical protein
MLQFLKCRQQIRYRAAPPIQAPNENDVDLAAACGLQQFLTSFSLGRTGADLTDVHGNGPAPPGSILPHGATLHGQRLIVRGNAGVQADAEHFRRLPCLAKNVAGFCLRKGLFGGHFGTSPNHGRSRSFPAGIKPWHDCANGVVLRTAWSVNFNRVLGSKLLTLLFCLGWVEGFEPSTSRTTIRP